MESIHIDSLQNLAKCAKQRMKQGYWQKIIESRYNDVREAQKNGKDKSTVITYYKNKVLKDFYVSKKRLDEEERVYAIVIDIMEAGDEAHNALAMLVDHAVFDELGEDERVRYMLEISDLYIKMRKRYRIEHKLI